MRVESRQVRRSPQTEQRRGRRTEGRLGVSPTAFEAQLTLATDTLATLELDELLRVVETAGRQLLVHRGEAQLAEYKAAVKEFISRAVERCFEVVRSDRFNLHGQRVITVLVRRVDRELEELTAALASKHSPALRLAARLDEIRGLLLDFYR